MFFYINDNVTKDNVSKRKRKQQKSESGLKHNNRK